MDILPHMTLKQSLLNGLQPSEKLAKRGFDKQGLSNLTLNSTVPLKDFPHNSSCISQLNSSKKFPRNVLKRSCSWTSNFDKSSLACPYVDHNYFTEVARKFQNNKCNQNNSIKNNTIDNKAFRKTKSSDNVSFRYENNCLVDNLLIKDNSQLSFSNNLPSSFNSSNTNNNYSSLLQNSFPSSTSSFIVSASLPHLSNTSSLLTISSQTKPNSLNDNDKQCKNLNKDPKHKIYRKNKDMHDNTANNESKAINDHSTNNKEYNHINNINPNKKKVNEKSSIKRKCNDKDIIGKNISNGVLRVISTLPTSNIAPVSTIAPTSLTTPASTNAPQVTTLNDSTTRCICDFQHDDGFMICCDLCGTWQHIACMGVDKEKIPERYLCFVCHPRAIDKHMAICLQTHKREVLEASKVCSDSSATETDNEIMENNKLSAYDAPYSFNNLFTESNAVGVNDEKWNHYQNSRNLNNISANILLNHHANNFNNSINFSNKSSINNIDKNGKNNNNNNNNNTNNNNVGDRLGKDQRGKTRLHLSRSQRNERLCKNQKNKKFHLSNPTTTTTTATNLRYATSTSIVDNHIKNSHIKTVTKNPLSNDSASLIALHVKNTHSQSSSGTLYDNIFYVTDSNHAKNSDSLNRNSLKNGLHDILEAIDHNEKQQQTDQQSEVSAFVKCAQQHMLSSAQLKVSPISQLHLSSIPATPIHYLHNNLITPASSNIPSSCLPFPIYPFSSTNATLPPHTLNHHPSTLYHNTYTPELRVLLSNIKFSSHNDKPPSILNNHPHPLPCRAVQKHNQLIVEAVEDMAPGQAVVEYVGKVMLRDQYHDKWWPEVLFYSKFGGVDVCVDASMSACPAKYVRRSCMPNAEVRHCLQGSALRFFLQASKHISEGSEITIAFDFNYHKCGFPVECACTRTSCPVLKFQRKEFNMSIKRNSSLQDKEAKNYLTHKRNNDKINVLYNNRAANNFATSTINNDFFNVKTINMPSKNKSFKNSFIPSIHPSYMQHKSYKQYQQQIAHQHTNNNNAPQPITLNNIVAPGSTKSSLKIHENTSTCSPNKLNNACNSLKSPQQSTSPLSSLSSPSSFIYSASPPYQLNKVSSSSPPSSSSSSSSSSHKNETLSQHSNVSHNYNLNTVNNKSFIQETNEKLVKANGTNKGVNDNIEVKVPQSITKYPAVPSQHHLNTTSCHSYSDFLYTGDSTNMTVTNVTATNDVEPFAFVTTNLCSTSSSSGLGNYTDKITEAKTPSNCMGSDCKMDKKCINSKGNKNQANNKVYLSGKKKNEPKPTEEKKKTREEKKLEAYVKAFERMEKKQLKKEKKKLNNLNKNNDKFEKTDYMEAENITTFKTNEASEKDASFNKKSERMIGTINKIKDELVGVPNVIYEAPMNNNQINSGAADGSYHSAVKIELCVNNENDNSRASKDSSSFITIDDKNISSTINNNSFVGNKNAVKIEKHLSGTNLVPNNNVTVKGRPKRRVISESDNRSYKDDLDKNAFRNLSLSHTNNKITNNDCNSSKKSIYLFKYDVKDVQKANNETHNFETPAFKKIKLNVDLTNATQIYKNVYMDNNIAIKDNTQKVSKMADVKVERDDVTKQFYTHSRQKDLKYNTSTIYPTASIQSAYTSYTNKNNDNERHKEMNKSAIKKEFGCLVDAKQIARCYSDPDSKNPTKQFNNDNNNIKNYDNKNVIFTEKKLNGDNHKAKALGTTFYNINNNIERNEPMSNYVFNEQMVRNNNSSNDYAKASFNTQLKTIDPEHDKMNINANKHNINNNTCYKNNNNINISSNSKKDNSHNYNRMNPSVLNSRIENQNFFHKNLGELVSVNSSISSNNKCYNNTIKSNINVDDKQKNNKIIINENSNSNGLENIVRMEAEAVAVLASFSSTASVFESTPDDENQIKAKTSECDTSKIFEKMLLQQDSRSAGIQPQLFVSYPLLYTSPSFNPTFHTSLAAASSTIFAYPPSSLQTLKAIPSSNVNQVFCASLSNTKGFNVDENLGNNIHQLSHIYKSKIISQNDIIDNLSNPQQLKNSPLTVTKSLYSDQCTPQDSLCTNITPVCSITSFFCKSSSSQVFMPSTTLQPSTPSLSSSSILPVSSSFIQSSYIPLDYSLLSLISSQSIISPFLLIPQSSWNMASSMAPPSSLLSSSTTTQNAATPLTQAPSIDCSSVHHSSNNPPSSLPRSSDNCMKVCSAKKRWLNRAMEGQTSTSSCDLDMSTPLKKRRLARESVSSEDGLISPPNQLVDQAKKSESQTSFKQQEVFISLHQQKMLKQLNKSQDKSMQVLFRSNTNSVVNGLNLPVSHLFEYTGNQYNSKSTNNTYWLSNTTTKSINYATTASHNLPTSTDSTKSHIETHLSTQNSYLPCPTISSIANSAVKDVTSTISTVLCTTPITTSSTKSNQPSLSSGPIYESISDAEEDDVEDANKSNKPTLYSIYGDPMFNKQSLSASFPFFLNLPSSTISSLPSSTSSSFFSYYNPNLLGHVYASLLMTPFSSPLSTPSTISSLQPFSKSSYNLPPSSQINNSKEYHLVNIPTITSSTLSSSSSPSLHSLSSTSTSLWLPSSLQATSKVQKITNMPLLFATTNHIPSSATNQKTPLEPSNKIEVIFSLPPSLVLPTISTTSSTMASTTTYPTIATTPATSFDYNWLQSVNFTSFNNHQEWMANYQKALLSLSTSSPSLPSSLPSLHKLTTVGNTPHYTTTSTSTTVHNNLLDNNTGSHIVVKNRLNEKNI